MNLIKKTILILSLFCVAMPARAMEAGNAEINLSVLDKIVIGAKVLKNGAMSDFLGYSIYTCLGLSHTEMAKDHISSIRRDIDRQSYRRRAQKCQPWIDAAKNPDLEETKALIAKEGYLKEKDHNGYTPLHWATYEGHVEKVKLLLAHGSDVNAKDHEDVTPLHLAVMRGHERLVMLLLAYGADVNARSLLANTPLHTAVDNGKEDIAKLLLANGADVDAKNNWSITSTPLNSAVFYDRVPVVKLLLDYGANIYCDIDCFDGRHSALWWSAREGHIETVRSILQHAGFSPAKKSTDSASQARIKEALLVCMRNRLPRDVRNKIISYLPEDILNQTHCRLDLTHGADVNKLVAEYPFEWFLSMYDAVMPGHKSEFVDAMVPAITEYRMAKVRELLADPKLQGLDPATTDPLILAMLDVANIEQHRSAIEQNVRKAFTSRIVQKYPTLKPIDLDKRVEDVLYADVQKKIAHD